MGAIEIVNSNPICVGVYRRNRNIRTTWGDDSSCIIESCLSGSVEGALLKFKEAVLCSRAN